MPDDLIQSGVVADTALIAADVPAIPAAPILPTPAAADTPAVAAAPAVVATPAAAVAPVNTDILKALLLTLGHDIEAEWDHLVALAKKTL